MKALSIKNLQVSAGKKPIVKSVSLTLKPGEIHAIMGPNGSGKSTLAQALMGHPQYQVKAKKLSLNGTNIKILTPNQRAKLGLFLAFQYPVSIEGVSVQNLLRQSTQAVNGQSNQSVLEFRDQLAKQAVRLSVKKELLSRSLNQDFSGGEKKRIEILQLLTLKPKYAILDETDSGLDIDAIKTVAKGIRTVVEQFNTGVIIITHYQRILKYLTPNKVHLMINGQLVKSGDNKLAKQLEKSGYEKWIKN